MDGLTGPELLDATRVDPEALDAFLHSVYPAEKSRFLRVHGSWWHRSNANRLVVSVDDRIAGYCAVIPARVWVAGRPQSALWWVDLVIAPEFRGQGLQSILDRAVRDKADLLIGFPNELAAKIHRKHGWGVRDDMEILFLPLRPRASKSFRRAAGRRGALVRLGAWGMAVPAALWRTWLMRRRSNQVRKLDRLEPAIFENVSARVPNRPVNTTVRDRSFFEWRYGRAPHPEEYTYYLGGSGDDPMTYLIARHVVDPDGFRYTRILDLFGDFSEPVILDHLLTSALQDAILRGSGQVTLLSGNDAIRRTARQLGFIISAPFQFCWLSDSEEMMAALAGENYWTLGDSDNDAPD